MYCYKIYFHPVLINKHRWVSITSGWERKKILISSKGVSKRGCGLKFCVFVSINKCMKISLHFLKRIKSKKAKSQALLCNGEVQLTHTDKLQLFVLLIFFFISFYSKTSIQQVVSVWFTSIYIIIIISIYIFLLKCSGQDVMLAVWELATIQTVEHFYWFYKSINKLQTSYKCQQPRQMIIGVIQGRCSQKV